MKNTFFKPTPLYKEFVLLDLIEKNEIITQRQMSDYLDVSVSMVNSYLDSYEQKGY
ncbi:MAG: winged helix-turn-helix transcriptional regulator, partial [Candidatus Izimaplasma sp.]|nr:winged helix-turn-helix transcriptional regulator [Candidatus Izimaplasma bacterium]